MTDINGAFPRVRFKSGCFTVRGKDGGRNTAELMNHGEKEKEVL